MDRIRTRARQLRHRLYGSGDAFDYGLSDEDLYEQTGPENVHVTEFVYYDGLGRVSKLIPQKTSQAFTFASKTC
jgi:hypothetical protein